MIQSELVGEEGVAGESVRAGGMREHVALHSQRASAAKDPPNVLEGVFELLSGVLRCDSS